MRPREKTQDDLFEQTHSVDKKIRKKVRFLLPDIKNSLTLSYENALFIMIGILMACIISFSLGVEKGRYDQLKSEPNLRSRFDLEAPIYRGEGPKKGVSNVTTSKPKNIKLR